MERKLVTIQVVESVAPIAGADAIEQARVMGWTVVVKKGEFAPGDRCVFFEIDSVLPAAAPWAAFLAPRGYRVRTLRLRGVLSQGLALPTAILDGDVPEVGTDVTARVGVTKFEVALPDTKEIAGPFPPRVPKTDEIRLQSALGVLDELRGRDFYVTTKLDGSSATFYRELDGALIAASRNWAIAPGANHVWRIAERHAFATRLSPGLALQGELCGPGIQKNRLGLGELTWFCFSIYDVRAGRFLALAEMQATCAELGVSMVPIERVVTGAEATRWDHTLDRWLELARGLYPGTRNNKEGIVIRPLVETRSEVLGGRLSVKVINNDFLLKDED